MFSEAPESSIHWLNERANEEASSMLRTNELERVSDNVSVILCLHFT